MSCIQLMVWIVCTISAFLFFIHKASLSVIRFAHVSSLRLVDASHLCCSVTCDISHRIASRGSVAYGCVPVLHMIASCGYACSVNSFYFSLRLLFASLMFQPSYSLACRCFASLIVGVCLSVLSRIGLLLSCVCVYTCQPTRERKPL